MRGRTRRAGGTLAAAVLAGCVAAAPGAAGMAAAAPPARPGAPGSAGSGPAGPVLGTSVLSVRRVPAWIDDVAADQQLAASLRTFVASTAALHTPGVQACLEVSQGDRVLFADQPDAELLPASNMKLLTAGAALDELGPGFRYTTAVKADRAPVGGIIDGNLYLVGGGDPLLRSPAYLATLNPPEPVSTSLAQLAAQVRAAGVTGITGAVVGDESRYDTLRTVPTWKPQYEAEGDAGPLSALEVDDGDQLTPPRGPAAQPAVQAAQVFTSLLQADGITVTGPAASGVTPATAFAVTAIQSAPLSQVLGAILIPSDDTGAELVTKELGHDFGGAGSTAAGVAVIRADLAADGLPVDQLVADDGSGLDRGDRVTCALVSDLLDREQGDADFVADLPVAGRSGTLAGRFVGTAAAGRLRAKTGTLDDVTALSGYVDAGPHPPTAALGAPLVFSLIMNGIDLTPGQLVGNLLGPILAAYPTVPAPASLGPAPLASTFPSS